MLVEMSLPQRVKWVEETNEPVVIRGWPSSLTHRCPTRRYQCSRTDRRRDLSLTSDRPNPRGDDRRSVSFDFFRANIEATCQDFQRCCVRFRDFVAFEPGDFLGGNRCEVGSFQTPLFSQPQQGSSEGSFALPTLFFETAPVGRVKLVKDRVCRDFVVAKGDRQAVVRQLEPGEIGGRTIS
jgi:hypothetical protein